MTNFALPRQEIAPQAVRVRLTGAPKFAAARIRRIDAEHADPKQCWLEIGAPEYLAPVQVQQLLAASVSHSASQPLLQQCDAVVIELTLPPFAVATVRLSGRL